LAFFLRRFTPDDGTAQEQRLVQEARKQNRAAFDALVYAHHDRLRAFLLRRVGADAVEDVIQETFLAAWQALPRLDLRVRFKTWLFSIAVHKAADYHRSQGRRSEAETPLDFERLPALPSAQDTATDVENRATVQLLLDHLSDEQRQLLEMYYFAELTLPEIATVLNRNLNTLKYQFYRAHALAAQHLEQLDMMPQLETAQETAMTQKNDTRKSKKVVLEG
jgi:RNA polymerase sigma-70 factor (ECF subfamily)